LIILYLISNKTIMKLIA